MNIHVVGGCYREICHWPPHDEVHGSGGRAAQVIAQLSQQKGSHLHSMLDPLLNEQLRTHFAFLECEFDLIQNEFTPAFEYSHPLARPKVYPSRRHLAEVSKPVIEVSEENVVIFGMIEASPKIQAQNAVYDPQDVESPVFFKETGSTADRLVLILNHTEAVTLFERIIGQSYSGFETAQIAQKLLDHENAQAVIVKCGYRGALVLEKSGESSWIPAHRTSNVFPIGSGDCYVGAFAYFWMAEHRSVQVAAQYASSVTAFYCDTRTFPDAASVPNLPTQYPLAQCEILTDKSVYLAGPFFNLKEMWLINQARGVLQSMKLSVFSPYHDVGMGSADQVTSKDIEAIEKCDALFAMFDGGDPGTLFEIGYAKKCGKPVVIYAENATDEHLKIYMGTGCIICSDFTTSIYQLLWALND